MDLMNIMSTQKHFKMNVTNVFVVFSFKCFKIFYTHFIYTIIYCDIFGSKEFNFNL